MSLADKCIAVGCFVCGDYDKILMKTGIFSNNLRVTGNGLVSGVDRVLKSSNKQTIENVTRDNRDEKSGKIIAHWSHLLEHIQVPKETEQSVRKGKHSLLQDPLQIIHEYCSSVKVKCGVCVIKSDEKSDWLENHINWLSFIMECIMRDERRHVA